MWDFSESENQEIDQELKEDIEETQNSIENRKKEILDIIENNVNFDKHPETKELFSDGITMLVGNKKVKFEISDVEDIPTDEIYKQVKKLYQEKLYEIWEKISSKIDPLSEEIENIKDKLSHEIKKSKNLRKNRKMPEINEDHISRGISVVPGEGEDEIYWYVDGIFRIDSVDDNKISEEYSKLTETPTKMMVTTRDDKITELKIKRWCGDDFLHYHSIENGREDCWGDFNPYIKWETPNDIIEIAEKAFLILRDINTYSIGDSCPPYLPPVEILKKEQCSYEFIEYYKTQEYIFSRMGVFNNKRDEKNYIWNISESNGSADPRGSEGLNIYSIETFNNFWGEVNFNRNITEVDYSNYVRTFVEIENIYSHYQQEDNMEISLSQTYNDTVENSQEDDQPEDEDDDYQDIPF